MVIKYFGRETCLNANKSQANSNSLETLNNIGEIKKFNTEKKTRKIPTVFAEEISAPLL